MTREDAAKRAIEQTPGCQVVPVQNFLWSLMGTDKSAEQKNLLMDAMSYRWKHETVIAISRGLDLFYNGLN